MAALVVVGGYWIALCRDVNPKSVEWFIAKPRTGEITKTIIMWYLWMADVPHLWWCSTLELGIKEERQKRPSIENISASEINGPNKLFTFLLISGILLHTDTLDAAAMPPSASACQVIINIFTYLYNLIGGNLNDHFMMKAAPGSLAGYGGSVLSSISLIF